MAGARAGSVSGNQQGGDDSCMDDEEVVHGPIHVMDGGKFFHGSLMLCNEQVGECRLAEDINGGLLGEVNEARINADTLMEGSDKANTYMEGSCMGTAMATGYGGAHRTPGVCQNASSSLPVPGNSIVTPTDNNTVGNHPTTTWSRPIVVALPAVGDINDFTIRKDNARLDDVVLESNCKRFEAALVG